MTPQKAFGCGEPLEPAKYILTGKTERNTT